MSETITIWWKNSALKTCMRKKIEGLHEITDFVHERLSVCTTLKSLKCAVIAPSDPSFFSVYLKRMRYKLDDWFPRTFQIHDPCIQYTCIYVCVNCIVLCILCDAKQFFYYIWLQLASFCAKLMAFPRTFTSQFLGKNIFVILGRNNSL